MSSDLSEFIDVFLEECDEGLDAMESGLIALDSNQADPEEINTIFRAAHSIKGGAATFDFTTVAEFTHIMETLLDEMRDGRRPVTKPAIDLLLTSVDGLRSMINAIRAGEPVDEQRAAVLKSELEQMLAQDAPATEANPACVNGGADDSKLSAAQALDVWSIKFVPHENLFTSGNDPQHVFRFLEDLGRLEVELDTSALPPLEEIAPESCYLSWSLTLTTDAGEDEILEAFAWVEDQCTLELERRSTPTSTSNESAPRDEAETSTAEAATPCAPTVIETPPQTDARGGAKARRAGGGEGGSIRVSIEKMDELINLVGELVITQSMLNCFSDGVEESRLDKLRDGLAQLSRNTRELQEMAMQLRMLPISTSFNRFPRIVRDLGDKLGKKVDLRILGESTELDKTVLELIGDPLVHLVRNSMDHGIETPDVRRAAGKPEVGVLQLNAYHHGGNIIVEVQDDGAGLNTAKILEKSKERGVVGHDAELSDDAINNLIFQPGFSTADEVSDVSGRGVGMDVVRRNIQELGGNVSVESHHGQGSVFTIRLPLTLAILDGQLVRVGDQIYIISLLSIVESLQIDPNKVNMIAGRTEVYQLREEFIPIIRLHDLFDIEPDSRGLSDGLLVIVEADGRRVGLFVDDLLGQQQVVIKSLETNFYQIDCLSGATILGNGSVALILDIPGLVQHEFVRGGRVVSDAAAA